MGRFAEGQPKEPCSGRMVIKVCVCDRFLGASELGAPMKQLLAFNGGSGLTKIVTARCVESDYQADLRLH